MRADGGEQSAGGLPTLYFEYVQQPKPTRGRRFVKFNGPVAAPATWPARPFLRLPRVT